MKVSKWIIRILLTVLILLMLNNIVYANIDTNISISETTRTEFKGLFQTLLGFFQVLASIIAVIVLLIIGIKYMTGSVEEKAAYKKTMIPYIVGALLIFGTTGIMQLLYNFFEGIN